LFFSFSSGFGFALLAFIYRTLLGFCLLFLYAIPFDLLTSFFCAPLLVFALLLGRRKGCLLLALLKCLSFAFQLR
jgi:hypothetical protein